MRQIQAHYFCSWKNYDCKLMIIYEAAFPDFLYEVFTPTCLLFILPLGLLLARAWWSTRTSETSWTSSVQKRTKAETTSTTSCIWWRGSRQRAAAQSSIPMFWSIVTNLKRTSSSPSNSRSSAPTTWAWSSRGTSTTISPVSLSVCQRVTLQPSFNQRRLTEQSE